MPGDKDVNSQSETEPEHVVGKVKEDEQPRALELFSGTGQWVRHYPKWGLQSIRWIPTRPDMQTFVKIYCNEITRSTPRGISMLFVCNPHVQSSASPKTQNPEMCGGLTHSWCVH